MAFLSRYTGTITVPMTDLGDADGTEYWVTIKKMLTAEETDRAEDTRISATNVTPAAGRTARALAARRRAGNPAPGDEEATRTLLAFHSGAYNRVLLDAGIVEWNLTEDVHGHPQVLPLAPPEARARSLEKLPPAVRNRIVEAIEDTLAAAQRTAQQDADFPSSVPLGGVE